MLNKKFLYIIIASICVVLIAFLLIFTEVSGVFRGKNVVRIEVSQGSSFDTVAESLKVNGVIGSKTLFKIYYHFYGNTYYMGTHEFSSKSYSSITKELGTVSEACSITVTIPEGMEQREIAQLLEEKGLVTAKEFSEAAIIENFDYWFLKNIKKRDMQLEGYLFPDTYNFSCDEDAKSIITKMLDNFDSKFDENMKTRAAELGLSVDEIITMASIVEREAADKNEFELVAGVFYNRLNPNLESVGYLQSCATVQYVLAERKSVLSISDTQIVSPYNTYVNKGLPVGPIASPGLDCINAALYPETTDYLYFVADGNGTHYFAKTIYEHNQNMRKAGLL